MANDGYSWIKKQLLPFLSVSVILSYLDRLSKDKTGHVRTYVRALSADWLAVLAV